MQPLLEALWKSDKGWTRAELIVRQRDKSRFQPKWLCLGSVNKCEMQRDFIPEVLQRLWKLRGEESISFAAPHTHTDDPSYETPFIFVNFLSLQHITLLTHSTLSGHPARVQSTAEGSVSFPCVHEEYWEHRRRIHRGGWGLSWHPKCGQKEQSHLFGWEVKLVLRAGSRGSDEPSSISASWSSAGFVFLPS